MVNNDFDVANNDFEERKRDTDTEKDTSYSYKFVQKEGHDEKIFKRGKQNV
ncbi:MAG: hypothetical protein IPL53_25550 [Ignavibacteria bacterium]|nr:hypothetical protein [Ignavibacteria bacterium]